MAERIPGARRRMISTRISLSQKVASLSWQAEAIYLRIIPHADDAGRMTADASEFRAVVLPLGKSQKQIPLSQIRKCLSQLYEAGLIVLYSVENREYLEVCKWDDFQTIKGDRPRTIICPPSGTGILWNPMESNASHSLGLGLGSSPSRKHSAPNDAPYTDEFESWWACYPKKVDKRKAFRAFAKVRLPLADLISATKGYAAECTSTERILKDPATFLSDRDRPYVEWFQKVMVEKAQAELAKEQAQARADYLATRQPAPAPEAKPDPDGAKKIRDMAKNLSDGMEIGG